VGAAAKKVAVQEALDAKHLLRRQLARELMDAIKARQLAKAAKDVKRRAIADRACMVRQATANVAKRKAKAAKRKAKAADAQDASNAPDAKAVGPAPDAELEPAADAEVLEPAPDAEVLEPAAPDAVEVLGPAPDAEVLGQNVIACSLDVRYVLLAVCD
jgi:hypothetical protein